jgi:methylenetetrahydrofolate reductase (NADPH)
MKLIELLQSDKVTISCELFPPKQGTQLQNYKKTVAEMAAVKPAYMSVTYGATGGTSDYTVELANEVRNVNHIPALAHLTCASSTKEKVAEVIRELKEKQIENILALRGDIPANAEFPLPNQYHHASELIADIRAQGDFCIGGACYPEGHPEADTIFEDLDHLKEKVDAGCEFLTTQMFF